MNNLKDLYIPANWAVSADYNEAETCVERIFIERDIDIKEVDYSPHFGRHTRLREFCA